MRIGWELTPTHPRGIMAKLATAKFDPSVGSTVNAGIDDAFVPDVTKMMKETAYISIMTPLGDPFNPACVWGAPTCYWGLPATAKSDKVEQASIEANLHYATIYPGQRQPEDFSGVLVPTGTGVVIECLLGAVRYLNGFKRGVIFLDEMNGATRATEGAMLGFLQKRIAGDTPLEPGVRILCAANPPEYSTSGFALAPPTANRMCHLQVKCPPHRDWIHHMISEDITPKFDSAGTEQAIRDQWGSVYSHVKALFIGYIESQPLSLHRQPKRDEPQSGYCWSSPRTLRLAARMKATADILGYSDVISQALVEGCIGEGPAFDFYTWVRSADLPKPEEVLNGRWAPDTRRLDVAFAVLSSVTQYVTSAQDPAAQKDMAVGAWHLLNKFVDLRMGDMVVSAAHTLVTKGLSRRTNPALQAAADPVIRFLAVNKLLNYVEATS